MILDTVNKSLRARLGGAAATTNPDFVTAWADHSTTTFVPGATDGAMNGASNVDLVAAPSSGVQRQVKFISIQNRDTVAHTVTAEYVNSGTARVILSATLAAGERATWTPESAWVVYAADGTPRSGGLSVVSSQFMGGSVDAANLTAALTITSTNSFAVYLGTSPKASSTVTLRYRVSTALVTITWAEVGIFRGSVNLGGNPTLTRLGTADISGVGNSLGLKSTAVSLSTALAPGDDVWAVIGCQAATAMAVRAGLADDLQSGVFASLVARPSTVASPTAWTLAGATTAIPWVKAFIS